MIRGRLASLESMTWGEILRAGTHLIPSVKICTEAKERLRELREDDRELLVSLRITRVQRAWGIPDGPVVRLLWWDPEHLVYPVDPRD
jgi:hypothetical protein